MESLKSEKVSLEGEIGTIIKEKILHELCTEFVLLGKEKTFMPIYYLQYTEQIKNFEVQDDDIWLVTYPKTGTTWVQEMVWMIVNNLDFEGGKVTIHRRFPFLEGSTLMNEDKLFAISAPTYRDCNSVNNAAKQTNRPRMIKTHLPYFLLPDQIKNGSRKPKLIYVIRNAKDVFVSNYHHVRLGHGWNINIEEYTKLVLADTIFYGSFWKHVLGYWSYCKSKNSLLIKYEDMQADLQSVIKDVARFLQKNLPENQIKLLENHLSFESMKNNKSVNNEDMLQRLRLKNLVFGNGSFIRVGKVGTYRKELSVDIIKQLDVWTRENISGTVLENVEIFNM